MENIDAEAILGKIVYLVCEEARVDIPQLSESLITMTLETRNYYCAIAMMPQKTPKGPLFGKFCVSVIEYAAYRGN